MIGHAMPRETSKRSAPAPMARGPEPGHAAHAATPDASWHHLGGGRISDTGGVVFSTDNR